MVIDVDLLQQYKNILIKKTLGGATTFPNKSAFKNENMPNKEFAEELHKFF